MKSVILDALADRGTAAGILRFLQNTSTTASPELGKADGVAQQGSVRKRDGYVPERGNGRCSRLGRHGVRRAGYSIRQLITYSSSRAPRRIPHTSDPRLVTTSASAGAWTQWSNRPSGEYTSYSDGSAHVIRGSSPSR